MARLQQRHLQDLEPLLLAAGKADIDRALQHLEIDLEALRRRADHAHEIGRRHVALAARAPLRVERGLEEGHGRDAGDLDRILEREKHALGRALVRLQRQHALAVEQNVAARHLVVGLARR